MAVQVKFDDNSGKVLTQMDGNVERALTAMGIKAVNLILKQMQTGYGRPIRRSGDLMRDVNYSVSAQDQTVTVGNSLEYGPFVHEGTSRMAGRPYIRDALTAPNAKSQLRKVAEAYLKDGF